MVAKTAEEDLAKVKATQKVAKKAKKDKEEVGGGGGGGGAARGGGAGQARRSEQAEAELAGSLEAARTAKTKVNTRMKQTITIQEAREAEAKTHQEAVNKTDSAMKEMQVRRGHALLPSNDCHPMTAIHTHHTHTD